MSNQHLSSIAAIGLAKSATETLACLFRLSGHYQLVDFWSADSHDAILVNIDDPKAVQLWQTYKVNNPGVSTIIIARKPGRYSNYPYLPIRFVQRPCFAAQVLSLFARVCPPKKPAEQPKLIEKATNICWATYEALHDKLQLISEALFKSEDHLHNPYYK